MTIDSKEADQVQGLRCVGSIRPILNTQVGNTSKVGDIASHNSRATNQGDGGDPKVIGSDAQLQRSQVLEAVDGFFRVFDVTAFKTSADCDFRVFQNGDATTTNERYTLIREVGAGGLVKV